MLLVPGEPTNLKITTAADLAFARGLLLDLERRADVFRIGVGYDSHRTVEGRKLVLGGELIPSTAASRATRMATHCVMPSLTRFSGLPGQGDIGRHFPDTDPHTVTPTASSFSAVRSPSCATPASPSRASTPSSLPSAQSWRRISIASVPTLAGALDMSADAVSVKGKTNEGMGEIGRGEGMAVHAVALLRKI